MDNLRNTVARLAQLRATPLLGASYGNRDQLKNLANFGSNPGTLQGRYYSPPNLLPDAALVVVLHGCTQTAAEYDRGSGWSQLADKHGFCLLFPEQRRSNNPNLCFNWFSPADARRNRGEALSIRQMIDQMIDLHDIDRRRIYVTGLSAGGAMASIMLAAYPEIFAGGAIIAGLPFGCANSVGDAFARMRGQGYPSDDRLAAMIRDASDHDGPWPSISIWQGTADSTVDPSNAKRIIGQWSIIHAVEDITPVTDIVDGYSRQAWRDGTGRPVIEYYEIGGMGHGTPLDTKRSESCGTIGPYMLDVGISSTHHIVRFWGLNLEYEKMTESVQPMANAIVPNRDPQSSPARVAKSLIIPNPVPPQAGVHAIIEDALRTAGLMQ